MDQSLLSVISFFSCSWLKVKDKSWELFLLLPILFSFESSEGKINLKIHEFNTSVTHIEKILLQKKNAHQLFG